MAPSDADKTPYLVLARKYRPNDFSTLIGQDAMVRTLTNAFASGRIHHAFMLTGVRGIGKTTTARILARAFNYVGKTSAGPTLDLAEEGENCRAIIEGRHVDVIEMDAASNTGINDIREIIDSVKYGPVSAPFKVYIIDEVHMLSAQAFNGLLKTLEEPPPYVKFIFATTEICKVPVTILSRCQRFDLRRVAPDTMSAYLGDLLAKEQIAAEDDAVAMIVRAGDGSVRDCQSLLDQAIAHGGGKVTAQTVQAMLGLADRARIFDLFEAVMAGRIDAALELTAALYTDGAEPLTIINDLAGLTHMVTRLKTVATAASDRGLSPIERERGADLAKRLGVRSLTRAWQILIKGAEEVAGAGNGLQAAEMVLVRLAFAADLPTPDEALKALGDNGAAETSAPSQTPSGPSGGPAARRAPRIVAETAPAPATAPVAAAAPASMPAPASFAELVALAKDRRDLVIVNALETHMRLVSFAPGRLEIALTDSADPALVGTLSARLQKWTGRNWLITVSSATVATPTIREERDRDTAAQEQAATADPLVRAVLDTFPGARIVAIRERGDDALPVDPEETESE